MKFGGTSVASAQRIAHVADLITATDEPKIVVLSAMAGTTNALVEIGHQLMAHHRHEALTILTKLKHKYEQETQLLFPDKHSYDRAWTLVNETFFFLEQLCYSDTFTLFDEKKILARGELLSTAMMLRHLEDRGVRAVGLPALEYMRTNKQAEPDEDYIQAHLSELIKRAPEGTQLFITEGYICRNAFGDIDNLQRGGSDYTATLIGAALEVDEIQIWTDIDGMHNNDPRVVDKTEAVRQLNFEEAAELAYFGAKILHPTCVQPAKYAGIPVRLKNTMDPDAEGTIINNDVLHGKIKAIAAKEKITAIKIKSSRMLLATGFLRKVFEIFESYQTPIDMIVTSEVGVSMSIDNDSHLNEIVDELKKYGTVTVDTDMCIVCVVGDLDWNNVGFETLVTDAMKNIPVRMISYGGSNYNISFLIKEEDKQRALQSLSDTLFKA